MKDEEDYPRIEYLIIKNYPVIWVLTSFQDLD